jgi:hypothetical protein
MQPRLATSILDLCDILCCSTLNLLGSSSSGFQDGFRGFFKSQLQEGELNEAVQDHGTRAQLTEHCE